MTESFNRKLGRLAQSVSGTGSITSNAATASAWETARTLTLGGDLSGNVSIDGSQNVTLTATVSGNTVALGTDTTGDYVATVTAGTGITTTGTGEGAAVTVSIDSTVATLTGSQTLTNKTLTTPVISSISNTGTLTLPTSTDTLVGRATTDTLTNKTISGASNTLSNIGNSSLSNSTISGISLGSNLADLTVGTGVSLNSGTTYNGGTAKTISIGQAVGTGDNVTFAGVTADNIRVGVTGANEIDTSSGNLTIDSTGGTTLMDDDVNVTGNLQIDGNLTVSGTTVTMNATNLNVEDNMIYLNSGSAVANPDLGFAGNYNDGTYRHAGLFRDASDGVFKFFHQYTPEPDASAYIDITHGTFALAPLQAAAGTLTSLTVSGNTGIGGANPGSGRLYTQASAGGTSLVLTDATNSTFKVDHPSNAVTRFRNGSDTEWMRESSGNVAFDTNTLYVDATNNRVGVGTDEPQFLLHVHGATPVVTLKSTTTTGTTLGNKGLKLLFLSDSATPGNGGEIVFAGNADTGAERWAAISGHIATNTVSGNTGDLVFATKGSDSATTLNEVMRITGSGLVGIGSTNPVQKLDVYSTNGDVVRLAVTDGQGSTDFGIDFHIQNTGQTFARINANYRDSAASGSGKLEFNVRGGSSMQKAMVIDSNGRVGIGSTSPTTPLDVVGNINATNGVIASTFWTNTDIRKLNDGATLFFRNSAGTSEAVIDGTGQVGIGTTTPAVKLDVRGQTQIITNTEYQLDVQSVNSSAGASIRRYSASSYAYDVYQNPSQHWRAGILGSTAYTIYDYTNLTDRLTILPTGNVGIGLTNPGQKLHVAGNSLLVGTISQNATLQTANTWANLILDSAASTNTDTNLVFARAGTMMWDIYNDNGADTLNINTKKTGGVGIVASFKQDGNVGIGTTNPQRFVEIYGSALTADTPTLRISSADSSGTRKFGIELYSRTGADVRGKFLADNSGKVYIDDNGNGGIVLQANGGGGNVGIGTTNPLRRLHVTTSSASIAAFNGGETGLVIQDNTSALNQVELVGYRQDDNSYNNVLIRGASGGLLISSAGSVGIGTTSPDVTFQVNSTIGGGGLAHFVSTTTESSITYRINSSGINTGWVTGNASNSYFIYSYTLSGQAVSILSNGNVGIGATNPNAKLTVGSAVATNLSPIAIFDSTGNKPLFVGQTSDSLGLMIGHDGNDIQGRTGANFTTNGDLTINRYGGNVGIGTTNPGAKLDVFGDLIARDADSSIVIGNAGTNACKIYAASGDELYLGANNTYAFRFLGNGTNNVVMDNGGSLGIGVSPSTKLHISGSIANGTPLLTLQATTTNNTFDWLSTSYASGMTSGNNVIHLFGKESSTKNAAYVGYRHAGDNSNSSCLTFGMYAVDNVMNIFGNGNVAIGSVTAPSYKFEVNGTIGGRSAGVPIWADSTNSNGNKLAFLDNGTVRSYLGASPTTLFTISNISGVIKATFDTSGNLNIDGVLTEASSIALKENISPITDALSIIKNITGYTYDRKDGTATNQSGLIAEEVAQILPGVVSLDQDGNPAGVQYTKIIAYLVESIKELKSELDILKGQ